MMSSLARVPPVRDTGTFGRTSLLNVHHACGQHRRFECVWRHKSASMHRRTCSVIGKGYQGVFWKRKTTQLVPPVINTKHKAIRKRPWYFRLLFLRAVACRDEILTRATQKKDNVYSPKMLNAIDPSAKLRQRARRTPAGNCYLLFEWAARAKGIVLRKYCIQVSRQYCSLLFIKECIQQKYSEPGGEKRLKQVACAPIVRRCLQSII